MEDKRTHPVGRGRGTGLDPANRFGSSLVELDPEALDEDAELLAALARPRTQFVPDRSKSVISTNDSPDVSFNYSLNPYRGCEHGCSYCYARPTHEYLGYSAGLDFETKIVVKDDVPALFRAFLARPGWSAETVALSGVTDPYQPIERRLKLTRGCLEVAAGCGQPLSLITKNGLVVRDLDLLVRMAEQAVVHVSISITTLDRELARLLEPRTSMPEQRLAAVRKLTAAGVPVRVMIAPLIPGLNDAEIPTILAAVREAGAWCAGYQMLRLPGAVAPIFGDWLERILPDRKEKILGRIRAMREGKLNSSVFGERMRGKGPVAARIRDLFELFVKRYQLERPLPPYQRHAFRPPPDPTGQMWLF